MDEITAFASYNKHPLKEREEIVPDVLSSTNRATESLTSNDVVLLDPKCNDALLDPVRDQKVGDNEFETCQTNSGSNTDDDMVNTTDALDSKKGVLDVYHIESDQATAEHWNQEKPSDKKNYGAQLLPSIVLDRSVSTSLERSCEENQDISDSSSSPSPRKGEYDVQNRRLYVPIDALYPKLVHRKHKTVNHEDEESASDSDTSSSSNSSKGFFTETGSYDFVSANDDDGDGGSDDADSDVDGKEIGVADTDKIFQQQHIATDQICYEIGDDVEKIFENRQHDLIERSSSNQESDDDDDDEYFDASADVDDVHEDTETSGVLLPDLFVQHVENDDQEAEPPPTPKTPVPVLQNIRPDVFDKFSLNQGWIERVNKSLLENSLPKDRSEEANETELTTVEGKAQPDLQGENKNKDLTGQSSGISRRSQCVDPLKKSSSDNRHDHSPRQKSYGKTDEFTISSSKLSEHWQTSSGKDNTNCSSSLTNDSQPVIADSATHATTTKLRRSAYVSASKYKGSAKPGRVGFLLPAALRPRTTGYARALSQGGSSSLGREEWRRVRENSKDGTLCLEGKKTSDPSPTVRTCVSGALIPSWSSLPAFSNSDDTDLTVSHSSAPSVSAVAPGISKNAERNGDSRRKSIDSLSAPQRSLSNRRLPLILQPQYQHSADSCDTKDDPNDEVNSWDVKNRLDKSQTRNTNSKSYSPTNKGSAQDLYDAQSSEQAENSLRPTIDSAKVSSVSSNTALAENILELNIDNGVLSDSTVDNIQTNRRKRVDYELVVDAENDVMRVNYSEPHGLTRKPAVRRKRIAYQSKVSLLLQNTTLVGVKKNL
ncbi:hypothetical protein PoB_001412900 [Plakobranchus ocellatus]|uniref:Uncharacterized protein n=1 Tax=Plakobranchus ocellatus TaxID=259542 RepID=A0AAV3Z0S2_9GAST|nr:hypothetical protein PoB_001412900 [Plakobranchus ocellatus]